MDTLINFLFSLLSVLFILNNIKALTIGSSANLHKYFTSKEYRDAYDKWMNEIPK